MATPRAERFAALDQELEAALRTAGRDSTSVVVGGSEPVDLSPAALRTLHKVVHALAAGDDAMLTTTEAADALGVSRPYLTRLLKAGRLPYRMKGNRHMVPLASVHEFKAERDRKLDELSQMAAAEEQLGVR